MKTPIIRTQINLSQFEDITPDSPLSGDSVFSLDNAVSAGLLPALGANAVSGVVNTLKNSITPALAWTVLFARRLAPSGAELKDDLHLLTIIANESGFQPDASNPKSTAYGLLQLLKPTAQGLVNKFHANSGPFLTRLAPLAEPLTRKANRFQSFLDEGLIDADRIKEDPLVQGILNGLQWQDLNSMAKYYWSWTDNTWVPNKPISNKKTVKWLDDHKPLLYDYDSGRQLILTMLHIDGPAVFATENYAPQSFDRALNDVALFNTLSREFNLAIAHMLDSFKNPYQWL